MKKAKHDYHFAGPLLGPVLVVFGLPIVCYALIYCSNKNGSLTLYGGVKAPGFPSNANLASLNALWVYLAYLAFQAILHLVLPGKWDEGVRLSNGTTLRYKFTGKYNLVITAILAFWGQRTGRLDLAWAYDNYLALLTAAVGFSFVVSVALYLASFRRNGLVLAEGGDSESRFYNFFIGRELNPRLGYFDFKHFTELYPGLIGWILLDFAMVAKQYQNLGYVTPALWLVTVFQAIYVVDALWMEPAILTTMDITSDGFGYMLAFGNLAWVPFVYSTQARYLVDFPQELSWPAIVGLISLNALGYLIFRASNSQKNLFRKDPNHPRVKLLKTLKTERGTELIISGWWGMSRHVNYFGDWLLGWSYCLPCGFSHVVPYFYVIYFGILLAHRERRDDKACRQKYGQDWAKYCSQVRSRIIPMIY